MYNFEQNISEKLNNLYFLNQIPVFLKTKNFGFFPTEYTRTVPGLPPYPPKPMFPPLPASCFHGFPRTATRIPGTVTTVNPKLVHLFEHCTEP